jgi:hypothetical protein
MKQFVLIVWFAILYVSMPVVAKQIANDPRHDCRAYKAIIHGRWYDRAFIDDVRRTRSPYRSFRALAGIVELHIDTSQAAGDSLEVGAPGIHEGFSFTLTFACGHVANALRTNIGALNQDDHHYELGFVVLKDDTSLVIYHYDARYMLIETTRYSRIRTNAESALQVMVNKTLLSGRYDAVDSAGTHYTVTMTDDGRLSGIPGVKGYYVITDYVAGPAQSVDEICFDIQTVNQRCYAFEIQGKTIQLYKTQERDDRITLLRKKRVYTFVRK